MLALPLMLSSCATQKPPQAFHNTDNSALIIKSLDTRSCQVLDPNISTPLENRQVLDHAKSLAQRQTAVIILENYDEAAVGPQFRDRSVEWFTELRGLGYEHIFFLQGKGSSDPDGLITLARYD